MKTLVGILSLAAITFLSCDDKCRVDSTYVYYEPVYSTAAEIRAAVSFKPAQEMVSPGKIYVKDHILYVNESGKGIHLFDNTSPSNPKPLGFLNVPGSYQRRAYCQ